MSKRIYVGGRIESAEQGGVVTGANAILDDTKGKKQNVINSETDDELARLESAKQDVLTFDNAPTENSANPVKSGGVYAADAALQQAIEAILQLIPSAATAMNQLADKAFVNSTEATNTATFRGTYNVVTDLSLHYNSTHQEIATALLSVVQTADNNDYCFVQIPVSDSSGDIRVTERYKFNGTAWSYEYDLNNSGFTADQWAAINSTITLALVQKLGALPTAAELAQQLALKQNTLTFDAAPVAGSSNPVTSGGLYNVIAAINATIPSGASVDNKLVAESRLTQYVAAIVNALDATFNVTSTDGHVNVRLTQVDGVITSVEVITNDIASASALNTLAGRVTTNEGDIAQLQALYNALQQSAPIIIQPTDTWPVASPSATVIYRVIDRVNTPPQYYSDYMFSANDLTTPVLMATYNNAIDEEPTAGSNNLVKSGGVFSMINQLGVVNTVSVDTLSNGVTCFTAANVPTGLPNVSYGDGGTIITVRKSNAVLSDWDRQVVLTKDAISTRVYYDSGWQNWVITKFKDEITTPQEIQSIGVVTQAIDFSNYASGVYEFTAESATNVGLPQLDWGSGGILFVFRNNNNVLSDWDRQVVVAVNEQNVVYTRVYYNFEWLNWELKSSRKVTIECGQGKQYTTLRAAIDEATSHKDAKVIVYPGTYDLTQEFATELANHSGSGILLRNGVHVVFMPGAYVTCLVDVSNTWAYENFEPFRIANVGNGDFTLENINIRCKNTRYCVHDEASGADCQYHHKYLNCIMEQYDENPIAYFTQCIGGGLGSNGYIEVIGGKYKSSSLYYQTAHYTSPDDMQQPITFHNGDNAACDSKIIIRDVYLADKGYLRFGNYGPSTILTPVYVSGCRMYKPVFLMNETWSESQVQNFEIISFNNEVIVP